MTLREATIKLIGRLNTREQITLFQELCRHSSCVGCPFFDCNYKCLVTDGKNRPYERNWSYLSFKKRNREDDL